MLVPHPEIVCAGGRSISSNHATASGSDAKVYTRWVVEPGGLREPGGLDEPGGLEEPGGLREPGGLEEPGGLDLRPSVNFKAQGLNKIEKKRLKA